MPPAVRTVPNLRARVAGWRREGATVALVRTMAALHEGHVLLVRLARAQADRVVASVFVNPRQFGPAEDFAAYPRDEAADARALADEGCDLLYAPTPAAMYPDGFATTVAVAGVSGPLDGAARPGHFAGVATVVAKLLVQCAPDVAVFGEKDFQQLLVIRRLVRDLDLAVELVAAPTARTADGLALSSRNAYLSADERAQAPAMHAALALAAEALGRGGRVDTAEAAVRAALERAGFTGIDYAAVHDAETFEPAGPGPLGRAGRVLAAARLGRTRLIDNVAAPPAPR